MKRLIVGLLVMAFIGGCATIYQPEGFNGGYSDTRLDENVFNISFRGNAYIIEQKVYDFALLRSAEVTLNNGYKYFIITEDNGHTIDNNTYTSPKNIKHLTFWGNASSLITIMCFKEKPTNGISYNADLIYSSISQRYSIKKPL